MPDNVTRIGFLVPSLNLDWSANLIKSINSSLTPQSDICIFYENLGHPSEEVKFLTTNMADAFGYPGVLISTSLSTAYKLQKFPVCDSKWYYIHEPEWINIPGKQYEELAEIYQDDNLNLIVKNENLRKLMEDCWRVSPKGISGNFDVKKIIEIIKWNHKEQ
jgi:hypothetical protein